MKHVSIIIPQGHCSLPNIDGTHQMLGETNNLLEMTGREPLFKLELVGLEKEASQRNDMYTIRPDALIKNVQKTDMIIIPAMHGDLEKATELNKDFLPWIKQQYENGAEIVAFCVGTFFLAETGLLNGKRCATHWRFANEFRNKFPEAFLADDRIMTEDSGIYTSGGAYSYTNLVVYLIEKFAGRDVAVMISKAFMVDIDRYSQSPFIIFEGQKKHEDEPVKKVQEFIEKNYSEKIAVDSLCSMVALSRRNFERRFKKATCNSVTEYIQRVKMRWQKRILRPTERMFLK